MIRYEFLYYSIALYSLSKLCGVISSMKLVKSMKFDMTRDITIDEMRTIQKDLQNKSQYLDDIGCWLKYEVLLKGMFIFTGMYFICSVILYYVTKN